jgi:hypothetical protein
MESNHWPKGFQTFALTTELSKLKLFNNLISKLCLISVKFSNISFVD